MMQGCLRRSKPFSPQGVPPADQGWWIVRHNGLAGFGHDNSDACAGRCSEQTIGRLVPGMRGKIIRCPVCGDEGFAAHHAVDLDRLLGIYMDIGPGPAVCPYLYKRAVERAEASADF